MNSKILKIYFALEIGVNQINLCETLKNVNFFVFKSLHK